MPVGSDRIRRSSVSRYGPAVLGWGGPWTVAAQLPRKVVKVRVDDMNKNRVERTSTNELAGQVQENASELVRSVGDVAGKFIQEQPFTATLIALVLAGCSAECIGRYSAWVPTPRARGTHEFSYVHHAEVS
jgi:hypothetical protein